MVLFESMLVLMLVAILLLQLSRRLAVPYPTMLALAGVAVAALPWDPAIAVDPPAGAGAVHRPGPAGFGL